MSASLADSAGKAASLANRRGGRLAARSPSQAGSLTSDSPTLPN